MKAEAKRNIWFMVVAELVSQLDMSSSNVLRVMVPLVPQFEKIKFANPSVTLLVSQPLMSPYVAAAVVGSLHHALTAVPMLAFVMAVVSRRLAITNTERAARRLSLPSPNGNLVAAPAVCEKEAKGERRERERERERETERDRERQRERE